MRSWLAKSALDPDIRRHADEGADHSAASDMWPNCWRCSKKAKKDIKVVAYGVEDCGKLPGTTGEYYTDFVGECNHGEKTMERQIIRIEGFRWDWDPNGFGGDTIAKLAAIKRLPFFHSLGEPCIPLHTFRNFLEHWKS